MKPADVQRVGSELAVKWEDGSESFIPLETLRRYCPCAACRGEVDVMGNLYRAPQAEFSPLSFELVRLTSVGGYGVQPVWADGHSSGIYAFDYLHRLAHTA